MSANKIKIYHLGTEVATQHTHDPHLASEGDFTTSELLAINWCCICKDIFFIRDISNHQGNHLQQSATDKYTHLNLNHDFNWPRKNHSTTA